VQYKDDGYARAERPFEPGNQFAACSFGDAVGGPSVRDPLLPLQPPDIRCNEGVVWKVDGVYSDAVLPSQPPDIRCNGMAGTKVDGGYSDHVRPSQPPDIRYNGVVGENVADLYSNSFVDVLGQFVAGARMSRGVPCILESYTANIRLDLLHRTHCIGPAIISHPTPNP
jgi:hypothetical protein